MVDGGTFSKQVTASVDALVEQNNAQMNSIKSLPNPIVIVQDINEAQDTVSKTEVRTIF